MPGAPDALEERCDGARRTDLAHEVHRTDIDAELERSRCDNGTHLAVLQALLDAQASVTREAAVVRRHVLLAEPPAKVVRDALRHPARVREHERRAVFGDQLRQTVVDLAPLLVRGDGAEVGRRHFDPEIEVSAVADVDDRRQWHRRADEEACGVFDRMHRCRETDAQRAAFAERVEAGEREGEVAAALVAHERVELVDDDGADVCQQCTRAFRREHEVERLRRGDQDVRRFAQDRSTGGGRCIAGAERGADLGRREAELSGGVADLFERRFEVALDVTAQRLQRRDVDHVDAVGHFAGGAALEQFIDAREERRERLAGAGRCGDECVAAFGDGAPAGKLRFSGGLEATLEPRANGGMEVFGQVHLSGREKRNKGSIQFTGGC